MFGHRYVSNSVACLAQARGIPFAVLRAVSDDADTSLPMAARHATNPDGRAHIQSVLEALRAEPSQFFDLHKRAFEFVRAIGRLYDAYRVDRARFLLSMKCGVLTALPVP